MRCHINECSVIARYGCIIEPGLMYEAAPPMSPNVARNVESVRYTFSFFTNGAARQTYIGTEQS